MSNERSRGIPDSVKGCVVLLIAAGAFVAGASYGYVAISSKLANDREVEELKKEHIRIKARESELEKPKTWDTLTWEKDRKATLITRYRKGMCQVKILLTNFDPESRSEVLTDVKLLDSDGFTIKEFDSEMIPDWGRDKEAQIEHELYLTQDEYSRISSWTARA